MKTVFRIAVLTLVLHPVPAWAQDMDVSDCIVASIVLPLLGGRVTPHSLQPALTARRRPFTSARPFPAFSCMTRRTSGFHEAGMLP